jgi:hypothetical protein
MPVVTKPAWRAFEIPNGAVCIRPDVKDRSSNQMEYITAKPFRKRYWGQSTNAGYVIDSNSRTRYTAEIQVRTLAEELWGEVAHTIDYPTPSKSLACKEQIRVLARVTSGCTRLVDSIFRSHEEFNSSVKK